MDFVNKKNIFYTNKIMFLKISLHRFLPLVFTRPDSKGICIGMVLIYLQKAFDTIDHKILIEKMKCMGFSNDVTKLFECYLSKNI